MKNSTKTATPASCLTSSSENSNVILKHTSRQSEFKMSIHIEKTGCISPKARDMRSVYLDAFLKQYLSKTNNKRNNHETEITILRFILNMILRNLKII